MSGLFPTTHWSVVLAGADSGNPESRRALEVLCRRYWYPVYAHARFLGHDRDTAQDLTQGFFAHVLETHAIKVADPERGRFRAFLKGTFAHFLANERRTARAQKRGGGRPDLSIDLDTAESRYRCEPVETCTPEQNFERAWGYETNQTNSDLTGAGTAGDVNGDGYGDLIVGANEYDGPETNEGRAWVFEGSASGLSTHPTVLQIDSPGACFGFSTYTAGDVNGDGYDDVIVSAVGYTSGEETQEGAAFVYLGSEDGVSTSPAWSFESGQADAFLGWSAETAGDVNNDGHDDIIVGTEHYDLNRTDQGAAWVFLGSSSGLSVDPVWSDSGIQPDARYGFSASAAGDVNGDELDDVIVGARRFDNGETNEGRAFVYHGPLSAARTSDCSAEAP